MNRSATDFDLMQRALDFIAPHDIKERKIEVTLTHYGPGECSLQIDDLEHDRFYEIFENHVEGGYDLTMQQFNFSRDIGWENVSERPTRPFDDMDEWHAEDWEGILKRLWIQKARIDAEEGVLESLMAFAEVRAYETEEQARLSMKSDALDHGEI